MNPRSGSEPAPPQRVDSVEQLRLVLREHRRVIPVGGGTKPALWMSACTAGAVRVDVSGLRGVVAYDPAEYTFTARAGTPVREVAEMLAERGQYLPFDPPLAEAGATLAGVVASGVAGPSRFRFGGIRDFLIGIRFVDGAGEPLRGGGAVVKNAAGFDLPKLMVGSAGRLGILTEVTFKVFPAPPARTTLRADFSDLATALRALRQLARGPLELDALDLAPRGDGWALWIRLAGIRAALGSRIRRLEGLLTAASDLELLGDESEPDYWRAANSLSWAEADRGVARAAATPAKAAEVRDRLTGIGARVRFSSGANAAWIDWSGSARPVDEALAGLGLGATALRGKPERPTLGIRPGGAFLRRVAAVLDPSDRLGSSELLAAPAAACSG